MKQVVDNPPFDAKVQLLWIFCRLQLPVISLPEHVFARHVQRMFGLFKAKQPGALFPQFLKDLYPVDAYLTIGCLEGDRRAWETLFAARAGRSDRLLVDALRGRAVRLYPRDEEKQDSAVSDFWGHLIVSETPDSVPILARYDGQRPLVPWLIRIFQNWQISRLRSRDNRLIALAEDDVLEDQALPSEPHPRWHESFCGAARDWLQQLPEPELLLLGLRLRYRLSQREVANLLAVHEGTISRRISELRDGCLAFVGERLVAEGWTGDDLGGFIGTEMETLLLDEPRLSADHLSRLLGAKGKRLTGIAK
jgi:RNA polymerase sigma factor (sigma-70 family)